LNSSNAAAEENGGWNDTAPTSSVFSLGTNHTCNLNGETYVAYLFAGGKSTNNNAVSFDGTDDRLTLADSSDFTFGTGDFTIEGWFNKTDAAATGFFQISDTTGGLKASTTDSLELGYSAFNSSITLVYNDTYHHQSYSYTPDKYCHFAVCRKGSTIKVFIDGVELISKSDSKDYDFGNLCIGGRWDTNNLMKGKIANFRIVKGQALYTQGFIPPTEVFTTSSRDAESSKVKLICCNGSTTTAATVTPGTITAVGNPTVASSESIFDDIAANLFGDSGDQNVIKCGSYVGNGSSGGQSIFLGFEPQFIIQKNASANTGGTWNMYDSMRGVVTGGNDRYFRANTNQSEGDADLIEFTPTGFNVIGNATNNNGSGVRFIYLAIRRPDGYVGKPPELGNQVFTPVYGSANAPLFKANNHVVDFTLQKNSNFATQSADWNATSRLTSGKLLQPNTTAAETSNTYQVFDYQSGASSFTGGSGIRFGWLFKRHAGMDVVTYTGNGSSTGDTQKIPHGLNQIPEMVWVKNRGSATDWGVYHKDMHSSIPEKYYMKLNTNAARTYEDQTFDSPTATHFNLRHNALVNANNANFTMMLFSSVSGISKVGTYSGSGSTGNAQNIGFQPRFLMIKRINSTGDWMQFNSVSGFGNYLQLNTNQQQYSQTYVSVSSTGFSLVSDYGDTNESGSSYVYYAHA